MYMCVCRCTRVYLRIQCVCPDTLLQPQMKKKRSVASLEKRDLRSTNKYVLTQQQQDSDGGVSSQLVKV